MAYRAGSSMYWGVLAGKTMYRTRRGGAADSEGSTPGIGFQSSKTWILGPGCRVLGRAGRESGWSSGTSAELAVLKYPYGRWERAPDGTVALPPSSREPGQFARSTSGACRTPPVNRVTAGTDARSYTAGDEEALHGFTASPAAAGRPRAGRARLAGRLRRRAPIRRGPPARRPRRSR